MRTSIAGCPALRAQRPSHSDEVVREIERVEAEFDALSSSRLAHPLERLLVNDSLSRT